MLAIFDLDETLIQGGDSSQLFTEFLRAQEIERTDDASIKTGISCRTTSKAD